ncbi:cilia- and flagella-associated protein 251-like isoform X1 [Mustela erminea]|uniref:cilia- and flagella-associated protein 251-like isoform X1 n=1 Tax=Mustela erminea TaxID=36723 RepID=UPI0013870CD1|nr:cilia- and flagella-associated protein 251-like isoform X1 [Mustela erminea]
MNQPGAVWGKAVQTQGAPGLQACPRGPERRLGHTNVISCLCIREDRRWIATADKGPEFLIIIWDSFTGKFCIWWWTLAVEMPASTFNLLKEYGVQNYFTFNPTNNKELVSNSRTQVIYYLWYEEGDILAHSASRLTEKMAVKDVLTNYSAHLPC